MWSLFLSAFFSKETYVFLSVASELCMLLCVCVCISCANVDQKLNLLFSSFLFFLLTSTYPAYLTLPHLEREKIETSEPRKSSSKTTEKRKALPQVCKQSCTAGCFGLAKVTSPFGLPFSRFCPDGLIDMNKHEVEVRGAFCKSRVVVRTTLGPPIFLRET